MNRLRINDYPGVTPVASMRPLFEQAVRNTSTLSKTYPMEPVEEHGAFTGYADPRTNDFWTGFALGLRATARIASALHPGT